MNSYKTIYSLIKQGIILILITFLIQSTLTTGFDTDTQNYSRIVDPSIEVNAVDTGFKTPGATLYYNWYNYSNNPLALADRDAAFYDGYTTTVSSSSSALGLSSLSPNGVPLQNSVFGINYDFNNLQGKVIEGIEVRLLHAPWNSGNYANISVELQWNSRSLNTTSEKFDYVNGSYHGWDSLFKNVTLGSPTDLWGRSSWNIDDLSDQNFGVKIEVTDLFDGASESVDVAWVKLYYSDAPIVIIDPWIQIENIPPSVDFILGTELVIDLNSTVIDPSFLGYSPYNVTIFVNNSEVLTLTTWNNNTLLPFDPTSYLLAENVYNITIKFSATNGTDWIFREVSLLVNVLANTSASPTDSISTSPLSTTPISTTPNSITVDSTIANPTDSGSSSSELTEVTSDDPLALPVNWFFGVIFIVGITMIRRKR